MLVFMWRKLSDFFKLTFSGQNQILFVQLTDSTDHMEQIAGLIPNFNSQIPYLNLGIHLYDCYYYYSEQDVPSLEELPPTQLTTIPQIRLAFDSLKQLLFDFNQEALPSQEAPDDYLSYLQFKSKLFMQFYGFNQKQTENVNFNPWIFDTDNLKTLYERLNSSLVQISPLIKKKHGVNSSEVKIQGFLLLQTIAQILTQIKNAAFPTNLFSGEYLASQISQEQSTTFQKYAVNESKNNQTFNGTNQFFITHSAFELGYQIEYEEGEWSKQQQLSSQHNLPTANVNQHIAALEQLTNKKLRHFQFQLRSYYNPCISSSLQNNTAGLISFVKSQPLLKLSQQKLRQLKTSSNLRNASFDPIFRFHRKIIKLLQSLLININNKQTINKQQLTNSCISVYTLLQKWIQLTCVFPNELLVDNNFQLLSILYQIYPTFIQQNQDIIHANLSIYVKQLTDITLSQHFGIIQKIICYDQQLTYDLLTTSTVMTTLLSQQKNIQKLIQQFTPLLDFGIQLSKMSSISDKSQFISQVLTKIQSNHKDMHKSMMGQSRFKLKNIIASIDTILCVDVGSESLTYIRPYLRELKYILLLLEALKDQMNHHNINKSQHDQYNKLQTVAQYFSVVRNQCPIYQLKAQILLFITLFKLGYHSPKYKDNQQQNQRDSQRVINLRKHIVNLYSKIYSNSQNQRSLFLSRISSDQLEKRSSNQQYYHFDSSLLKGTQSTIWHNSPNPQAMPPEVVLSATPTLVDKIQRFIKSISSSMKQMKTTCKIYLINLMNLLESELFLQEKQHYRESEGILTSHYIEHIKKGLESEAEEDPHLGKVLELEGLFYYERYEEAWKMLQDLRQNNQHFNSYLDQLTRTTSNSNSLLKFVRIYKVFAKMSHLFFKVEKEQQDRNVQELISAINSNTSSPVEERVIKKLYQVCIEANRLQELQLFFQRYRQGGLSQSENEYEQFPCCLDELKLHTSKSSKNKKQLILVKIGQQYALNFKQLKAQIDKYYLLNNSGVSRIAQIKQQQGQLWIQLESNPFYNLKAPLNRSVLMIKNDDFAENDSERLARNFAYSLIQTYHLFNVKEEHIQQISFGQISFNPQEMEFNINPFFMLIQHSLWKIQNSESVQPKISNKVWLSNLLEKVVRPIEKDFSAHFMSNYSYLIQKLRNNFSRPLKYSALLELPLFMTLHEKEMFLVFFDNKMSEMADEYFNKQRQIKKQRRYSQLRQARIDAMKNGIYKNHRLNFIVNGVVQSQMIDLRICQKDNLGKLDWISQHKKLKISYQLPRNDKGEVKDRAYSLNCLMQCLRGAIAHKMDHSYDIILSFNQEFPQLIDFFYARKGLLSVEYDQIIEAKNLWLERCFSPKSELAAKEIKQFIGHSKGGKKNSGMINQAIDKLNQYCHEYQKKTIGLLKSARVKCDRCNKMLKIVGYSSNLIDLLANCAKIIDNSRTLLSAEHSYHNCFLASSFKYHRQLKIFGDRIKQSEIKNSLVLNWWFFLQTHFPCLPEMLNRIRYKLDLP